VKKLLGIKAVISRLKKQVSKHELIMLHSGDASKIEIAKKNLKKAQGRLNRAYASLQEALRKK